MYDSPIIRPERPGDIDAIRALTTAAFAGEAHSSGTEAAIIDALRAGGALTLSLVAVDGADLVGHVAFSPVTVDGALSNFFGLGPVSVRPDRQRRGIGSALIRQGLATLRASGADGCVLLGSPRYYARFGFAAAPELCPPGLPAAYFQAQSFTGRRAAGPVAYHTGFDAA